ncbi:MAG: hypothetical protein QXR26_07245 [Candidatus Caldarchaeum sp.]
MSDLAEKVRNALRMLRDPVSGAPALFLDSVIDVRDVGNGVVHIIYVCRDPHSPNVITYAEAAKTLASRCEGVKKVIIEVRNHVLADFINLKLNV